MLDKLNLPTQINIDDFSIIKREHNHDSSLWQIIQEHKDIIGKYLPWPYQINSPKDLYNKTEEIIAECEDGSKYYYCIADKNKNLIGAVYVLNIDYKNHNAEFGYWLIPTQTGKGYITKSVETLAEELFKKNIIRLIIRCDIQNKASENVAIRCGFEKEGYLRKSYNNRGRFADNYLYSRINPNT